MAEARPYTPAETAAGFGSLGPGRGGVPTGTVPRTPGESGYARVQEQQRRAQESEKKEIEERLKMSFGTLEQAQAELKARGEREVIERARAAERPSALQQLKGERQKSFVEQLRVTTPQQKFQEALKAQEVERKIRVLRTSPTAVFLEKATPYEREEYYRTLGITGVEQVVGTKGTILTRVKTKEGEITSLDPYARAKIEYEKRLKEFERKQKEELAKMTIQEKLIRKYIPEQQQLITSKIKGKPSWFKTWFLEAPVGFAAMTGQTAVAVTQKGLLKKEVAEPMAKYYIEELPSTPEGRKELYTQAGIMAVLWGAGLAFKKYTTGSFFKKAPKPPKPPKIKVTTPTLLKPRPYFKEIYPKVMKGLSKKQIEAIAKAESKASGVKWSKLSAVDKRFVMGQIEARIRTQPSLFIPKVRKIALETIRKQTRQQQLIQKSAQLRKLELLKKEEAARKVLREQPSLFISDIRKTALERFKVKKGLSQAQQQALKLQEQLKYPKGYTLISKEKMGKIFIDTSKLKPKIKQPALPKVTQLALEKVKAKQLIQKAAKLREKPPIIQTSNIFIKEAPKLPKVTRIALEKIKKLKAPKGYELISKEGGAKIFLETSKIKQEVSLLKTKMKYQPRQFLPQVQQQALQLIQKPKVKVKPLKLIKITEAPKITGMQLKTLQRYGFKVKDKVKVKQLKLFDIPEQIQLQAYRTPPIRLKAVTVIKQIKPPKVKARITRGYIPALISKEVEAGEMFGEMTQIYDTGVSDIKTLEETGILLPTTKLDFDVLGISLTEKQKQKLGMGILQVPAVAQVEAIAYQPLFEQQAVTQIQLEKVKQAQRQDIKQRERIKQLELLEPKIPKVPIIKPEFKPSPLLISAFKKIKKVPAFELFIKRKGKFKKIGEFEKAKAIKLGAKITKETLAATFMIKPLKKMIVAKPSPLFIPSPEIFRSYKIRKGVRVPLEFEWIQRRGKRLMSKAERREIQKSRREAASFFGTKKGSGFKWL